MARGVETLVAAPGEGRGAPSQPRWHWEPPAPPTLSGTPLGGVTFTVLLLPLPACRNPVVWDGGKMVGDEGKQK